jgi:mRNA interferase RelE/StbE
MYDLYIEAEIHNARQTLPGKIRQRVKQAIDALSSDPRPSNSRALTTEDLELPPEVEIRRIRLESWRILYAISDVDHWVWMLRIRRRPPYNYDDLADLASIVS